MRALTALASLLVFVFPAMVAAQDAPDDPRVSAYFATAVAGDAELTTRFGNSAASLDPTLGFGARMDVAVHDYVALGGSFELLTFEWDAMDSERTAVLNFDAWLRLRYAIELSSSLWIEPYVAFPFGLTLGILNDPDGDGDSVWPGFNAGAMGGAALILGDVPFAFFAEVGWRHHQVFEEANYPIVGDVDLKVVTNQFAMQFGASLRLD